LTSFICHTSDSYYLTLLSSHFFFLSRADILKLAQQVKVRQRFEFYLYATLFFFVYNLLHLNIWGGLQKYAFGY
jgi:hypothetical protein